MFQQNSIMILLERNTFDFGESIIMKSIGDTWYTSLPTRLYTQQHIHTYKYTYTHMYLSFRFFVSLCTINIFSLLENSSFCEWIFTYQNFFLRWKFIMINITPSSFNIIPFHNEWLLVPTVTYGLRAITFYF